MNAFERYCLTLGAAAALVASGSARTADRWAPPNDSASICREAIRERANQQFGLQEIGFRNLNAEKNRGRNDTVITGSFEVRRGNYRDPYRFSCAINPINGSVRGVEISQGGDGTKADRYAGRDNATSACQRAVGQRIRRDGYRNLQLGPLSADNLRNDWIAGTATAQRGNHGRSYDFDIGCSINLDNGKTRAVQVNRR